MRTNAPPFDKAKIMFHWKKLKISHPRNEDENASIINFGNETNRNRKTWLNTSPNYTPEYVECRWSESFLEISTERQLRPSKILP